MPVPVIFYEKCDRAILLLKKVEKSRSCGRMSAAPAFFFTLEDRKPSPRFSRIFGNFFGFVGTFKYRRS